MKPSKFCYHAPTAVSEAVQLLAAHGADAKVLAGGQSLVPLMALRLASFNHLIDLNRVAGLDGIERSNGRTATSGSALSFASPQPSTMPRWLPTFR